MFTKVVTLTVEHIMKIPPFINRQIQHLLRLAYSVARAVMEALLVLVVSVLPLFSVTTDEHSGLFAASVAHHSKSAR